MNTSAPCCWTMQGHLAQNSCMTFQTSKCCYPPQKNVAFANFLEINSLPLTTFQKTFLPTSPKAFLLPFSLTIFTMNELLPDQFCSFKLRGSFLIQLNDLKTYGASQLTTEVRPLVGFQSEFILLFKSCFIPQCPNGGQSCQSLRKVCVNRRQRYTHKTL